MLLLRRRDFATLVVRNAKRPISIYADWTDVITWENTSDNLGTCEDVVLDFGNSVPTETSALKVSIPRRITSLDIDSACHVHIAAKDRLEVEKHLRIITTMRNKDADNASIETTCSIRANSLELKSGKDMLIHKAVEAVKVNLLAQGKINALKRVSAVGTLHVCARQGNVEIATLYSTANAVDNVVVAERGNIKLGPVHAEGIEIKALGGGNVSLASLAGSCNIEAPLGNVSLHFDSSHANGGGGNSSSILAGGSGGATVSLAEDALPMHITGMIPHPEIPPAQVLGNGKGGFTLVASNKRNVEQDHKVPSTLKVTSPQHGNNNNSTVRLESWINNVLKNLN